MRVSCLYPKKTATHRLGLALLLKFYQYEGQFPTELGEIPRAAIRYVADQLRIDFEQFDNYDLNGRTSKAHRVAVRDFLGFREATVSDSSVLRTWLETQVLAYDLKIESLLVAAYNYLRKEKIEPPTPERLERLVRSALRRFERHFEQTLTSSLSESVRLNLDQLLETAKNDDEALEIEKDENPTPKNQGSLNLLKSDPGRLGLDSWTKEAAKLQQLRQLDLPLNLFNGISPKILEIYKQRVAVEPPRELRRHPVNRRYTMLTAFCWLRLTEITDNLVELLIQIVHRIGARAERRVEKELLDDFKKVSGKTGLLFQLAVVACKKKTSGLQTEHFPACKNSPV